MGCGHSVIRWRSTFRCGRIFGPLLSGGRVVVVQVGGICVPAEELHALLVASSRSRYSGQDPSALMRCRLLMSESADWVSSLGLEQLVFGGRRWSRRGCGRG